MRAFVAAAFALTSCGGSGNGTKPATSFAIEAGAQSVEAGASGVTLSVASVEDVAWTLDGPGELSAANGKSVVYSPPACVVTSRTASVTATSASASASLTLTVRPPASALSCLEVTASAKEVTIGEGVLTLTATVSAGVDASQVTWSVLGPGTLSPAQGATTTFTPAADLTNDITQTISASLGGLQAHAVVVVHARPSFPMPSNAYSMVFDGTSLWTANLNPTTLMKIRPSDGAILLTTTLPDSLGEKPALLFDGANVWVQEGALLSKVRLDDGTVIHSTELWLGIADISSSALAFDGANVYAMYGSWPSTIVKVRGSDGAVLWRTPIPGARSVTWDGARLWVSSWDNGGFFSVLTPDGALVARVWTQDAIRGATLAGSTLWVVTQNAKLLTVDTVTDTVVVGQPFNALPTSLAFDGKYVTIGFNNGRVFQLDPNDGSVAHSDTMPNWVTATAFDGTHTWAAVWGALVRF